MCLLYRDYVALSLGHSHFFNVTCRGEGSPGRRNHVSMIAQSLCTQKIEPYPNCTDSTNGSISPFGSLCYWFRRVTESTGVVYSHQKHSIRSLCLFLLRPLRQSSSLKSLLTIDAISSTWMSNVVVYWPGERRTSNTVFHGLGTVLSFVYKVITQ